MNYYIFLFIILLTSSLSFYGFVIFPLNDSFQYVSMAVFFIMSVWFIIRNRKESLFCPESVFFLLGFLITFYNTLVLSHLEFVKAYFLQFSEKTEQKSIYLALIAFSAFILGEEFAGRAYKKNNNKIKSGVYLSFPTSLTVLIHLLAFTVVTLVFLTGQYQGFLKYTLSEGESANMINIIISIILMVCSVLEFIRLYKLKPRPSKLITLIFRINKIYAATVIIWSLFLLLTGNRGEMMLIAFPPIILYFFFIKRLKNSTILLGAIVGAFIMIFIGLTRQGDSDFKSEAADLGIYGVFRDYGSAYVSQLGLIEYTESHGTYGYGAGFKALVSMVPFMGRVLYADDNSKGVDGNTNELTTENFSLVRNAEGGMGTNLLGDLYYAGGIFFVVFYMLIIGWFLSYAYERLFHCKELNVFSIFTYCWIFGDCLYILRAPYYHLFRQIGFSLIIYFILYVLQNLTMKQKNKIA